MEVLPEVSKGINFDPKVWEGKTSTIVGCKKLEMNSRYKNGKELPKGETCKVFKLKVYTDVVTTAVDGEGKEIEIRASELFGMTQTKDGIWGVPINEKAGINALLRRCGVKHYTELKGKQVILKASGNFLGFFTK